MQCKNCKKDITKLTWNATAKTSGTKTSTEDTFLDGSETINFYCFNCGDFVTDNRDEADDILSGLAGRCEVCDELYDVTTEPSEIKESGARICPHCWEKK